MRTRILEDFRDEVLRVVTARHGGVLLFAGKADPSIVAAIRDSIPEAVILFYLYPGNTDEKILCSALPGGKKMTLFSSLEDDAFPHEKAGILLTLKPSKNTCLKADNSIGDKYNSTIAKINEAVEQALSNAEQSRIAGLIYLRSSLKNLIPLFRGPRMTLKNNDASVPAVICCGGPSFTGAIPLLKEYEKRIALFSMARTSALLIDEGITPDVVVHVDPFYDVSWSLKASEKKCLLAAALSVSPSLSSKFENIIWFNGDSAAVNNYVKEKESGILNDVAISRTVTVPAIDIAVKAGFRKIILTGSDLCLSANRKSHADDSTTFDGSLMQIDGNSGEKVFTTPEFDVLRKSIENYIDTLPGNIEIYNGTEDGALIKNIPHRGLADLLRRNASAEKNISLEISGKSRLSFSFDGIISDIKKTVLHTDSKISAAEAFYNSILTGEQDKIKGPQALFNKLIGEKVTLSDKRAFEYLNQETGNFIDNTMSSLPELRVLDLNNPLTQLVLFIKRSLLQKDLFCDLLSDMTGSSRPDRPMTFSAFRNFALRFIAASNPGFAEYLDGLDVEKSPFKMVFSLQELPIVVKFAANGKTIFSYSVFEHSKKAREFANTLAEKYSVNPEKDALVFAAPVNYQNVVETAKKYPDADMMIVEIWPELLNQLISSAMFFNELPEKTIVAGPDDLESLVAPTIIRWRDSGKRILVVNTPESAEIDEAASLTESIRRLL